MTFLCIGCGVAAGPRRRRSDIEGTAKDIAWFNEFSLAEYIWTLSCSYQILNKHSIICCRAERSYEEHREYRPKRSSWIITQTLYSTQNCVPSRQCYLCLSKHPRIQKSLIVFPKQILPCSRAVFAVSMARYRRRLCRENVSE